MNNLLKQVLGWSEVWALFIPLFALVLKRKQPLYLKPVIIYILLALVLNLFQDIIANLKFTLHFPHWLQTNNYVYNFHSVARLFLFSLFFIILRQPFLQKVKKIVPIIFSLFVIINFTFFEDFFNFNMLSSRLLSLEAVLLLFYCLQYYLYKLLEENEGVEREPDFWVVTGLTIYVSVSFIIFLFQNTLVKQLQPFAITIWKVHDIVYIIFCFFLAKAFIMSKNV